MLIKPITRLAQAHPDIRPARLIDRRIKIVRPQHVALAVRQAHALADRLQKQFRLVTPGPGRPRVARVEQLNRVPALAQHAHKPIEHSSYAAPSA